MSAQFRKLQDASLYVSLMHNRRYISLLGAALLLCGFLLSSSSGQGGITQGWPWTASKPKILHPLAPGPKSMHDGKWTFPSPLASASSQISNGTLGFGAIYALGLPDRSDKKDATQLSAALTGLHLTWVEGVQLKDMNPKTVPPAHYAKGPALKMDGEIGCWRGHMNIIREIVRNGLSSALIIEDDADWDVHIERQMHQLAEASQAVLASTEHLAPKENRMSTKSDSPYGDGWDIIWVGHCGGRQPLPQFHQYHSVIRDDTTVPPAFDMQDLTKDLYTTSGPCSTHEGRNPVDQTCDSPRLAQNERILQFKGGPLCTFGYAVSQQGARKILARVGGMSVGDVEEPIDVEMMEMCREDNEGSRKEGVRCLVVSPPLFSSHKARSSVASDSDIHRFSGSGVREVGYSEGLVWSTKLNVENLIAGLEPDAQYVLDEEERQWRFREAGEYLV